MIIVTLNAQFHPPSHPSLPSSAARPQVRASNLQELVYKQGQAGITKATVSIVFDNHDKPRSPVGYEHLDEITVTRQLVIGGKNKYMINGKTAEASYVELVFIESTHSCIRTLPILTCPYSLFAAVFKISSTLCSSTSTTPISSSCKDASPRFST